MGYNYYVVTCGRNRGIFELDEFKKQVEGFSGASAKGFKNLEDAEAYYRLQMSPNPNLPSLTSCVSEPPSVYSGIKRGRTPASIEDMLILANRGENYANNLESTNTYSMDNGSEGSEDESMTKDDDLDQKREYLEMRAKRLIECEKDMRMVLDSMIEHQEAHARALASLRQRLKGMHPK